MGRLDMAPSDPKASSFSRCCVVAAFGFFGMTAQALLFRNFFTVFEGNEFGVSVFFASWLLWVAVGAAAARLALARGGKPPERFELLPLLYIPAYVLQGWLIDSSRRLAGVQSYELFPAIRMIPVSMIANAPLSFVTGILFTMACQWTSRSSNLPVARVYITEAVGAFAGGLAVTLLLAAGLTAERVFFLCSIPVAAAAAGHCALRRNYAGFMPLAAILLVLAFDADKAWTRARSLSAWSRLLPPEMYTGSFATHHARYLHGLYGEQFNLMAWESIAETVPNKEYASEIAAIHLSQRPEAGRVAVIGSGTYSICKRFLDFPGVRRVEWLHTDPMYPERMLAVLPEHLRVADARLIIPGGDPRSRLLEGGEPFDIVVVHLPEAATLALNRFFTAEFLEIVRERLSSNGIVGISVAGGDNFMGDELLNMGASVHLTLNSVFRKTAIKPGGDTWLIASMGDAPTSDADELMNRFMGIPGSEAVYPPEGILSLFPADRVEFQRQAYADSARLDPGRLLLNTDRNPRTLFYQILFAARQAGVAARPARVIRVLALCGAHIAVFGIVLYSLLRSLFIAATAAPSASKSGTNCLRPYDGCVMVFTAGAAAMSLNIALMFLYQAAHGSIFLHIGLINALFMAGLFSGGIFSERILSASAGRARASLSALIGLHLVLMLLVHLSPRDLPQGVFAGLFLLAGFAGGAYIPMISAHLKEAGFEAGRAGSLVEMNDHLGGAFGGLFAGLILIPVAGIPAALGVSGMLLALNLPVLLLSRMPCPGGDSWAGMSKRLVFAAVGLGILAMFSVATYRRTDAAVAGLETHARSSVHHPVGIRTVVLADGRSFSYSVIRGEAGRPDAYRFSTRELTPDIQGFGGPIVLTLTILGDGTIESVFVEEWSETPAYVEGIAPWLEGFAGLKAAGDGALSGVDAVTGATQTSEAVMRIVMEAADKFLHEVLTLPTAPPASVAAAPREELRRLPGEREPMRGRSRDADVRKLREMIRSGLLSDRESLYYDQAPD